MMNLEISLTDIEKKLESESKVLHQQKAKMLSVDNLLLSVKDKSKKNPIGENSKQVAEAEIPDNSNSTVEEKSKRAFERYFGLIENSF